MSVEETKKQPGNSPVKETAALARTMIRAAQKGALGTVLQPSGHPYASLLLVATEPDGTPVLLISKLALHTKNLTADPRATLLVDATGLDADPLSGARITLIGEARPTTSATARRRYLERHPSAAGFVDFPDFSFYAFDIASAHYIGGFGRIIDIPGSDLMTDISGAEALVEAEPGIVAHMNADHADAVALYATKLLGGAPGDWRMTGVDPEGCDLVLGARALRLPFGTRVTSGEEARKELVRLVGVARSQAA